MNNYKYKISLLFLIVFTHQFILGQCYIKHPLTAAQRQYEAGRSLTPRADWECDVKVIQVNFHFIQKSNGTRNFRMNDDGYGGNFTGFDFAHKVIEKLNIDLLKNEKMQIPPGNNMAVLPKRYKFVVKGVYFHQNDAAWSNTGLSHTLIANTSANILQEFNIIPVTQDNANSPTCTTCIPNPEPGGGGWASSISSLAGDKHTVVNQYALYEHFIFNNFKNQWSNPAYGRRFSRNEVFEYVTDGVGIYNHELNHLLSLAHTVMYDWGSPCATVKDNGAGSVDLTCDDFCWDTPSAWHMRDNLNAPQHPAIVAGVHYPIWGSNNRMEYSGYAALSPMQINRIHSALENSNNLRGYLLCERVKTDIALCAFDPNVTLFSGKKVTINKNCSASTQSIVNNKRYVKVIYNDNESTEIFNGFEVKDGGYFEILSSCVCN
jgi:hypothetical protein